MVVVVVHWLLEALQVGQVSQEFGWSMLHWPNQFRQLLSVQGWLGGRGGVSGFGSWTGAFRISIVSCLYLGGHPCGQVVVSLTVVVIRVGRPRVSDIARRSSAGSCCGPTGNLFIGGVEFSSRRAMVHMFARVFMCGVSGLSSDEVILAQVVCCLSRGVCMGWRYWRREFM